MKATNNQRWAIKILSFAVLLLLAICAAILLREYLMLKKIQATLQQTPSQTRNEPPRTAPAATEAIPDSPLVSAISRSADGGLVRARANFSAFKKKVESHPELLQQWGRVGWKIVGDIPALCIRSVAEHAPFRPLGVRNGDCITHIDGESINQPMRNMAIWLTLPARRRLKVDTLREGRRITYELVRK